MALNALMESSTVAWQRSFRWFRTVRPATWIKVGGCVALAVLCAAEIALRGDGPSVTHARVSHARAVSEAPRAILLHGVVKPDAAPAPQDRRSVDRLVAMTHAKSCAERSKAAEGLAGVHSQKAVAALKKLAKSKFKDESASPGVFSCNSRRAAQKALDHRGT
ncbi:MAG: hypothetical protein E6J88_11495 [Deltaproteobacteria bacterium]|nr:MAG: hypothetical protein E6J88_11495 [Deltaproteobacteria bacterium]